MEHGVTQFCLVPVCPCLYMFLCMYVRGHVHTWKHHLQCLFVGVCQLPCVCALLQGSGLGGCRLEHDSACLCMAQSHVCMHVWV